MTEDARRVDPGDGGLDGGRDGAGNGGRVVEHPVSSDRGLAELAESWLADPDRVDGPVRTAATVMLVRDGAEGPEVYVQRRVPTMAFAPSTVVFPGGGVDPADDELDRGTTGLAELAAAMGVTVEVAAPFAAAAVREVEEEAGVRLEVADLRGRAHWVTPAFEPRRYDTWILAAAMPEGQVARETSTESDRSGWVRAADLLARHAAGEVRMLPPTVISLHELGAFASAAAFLDDRPRVARVLPELVRREDGVLVLRTVLP